MEELKEVAKRTLALLKKVGADKAQCTLIEKETQEFNVDGGNFSLFRTLYDHSLAITAFKNGKKGNISINRFDDASIQAACETCLRVTESGVADEAWDIAPKQENKVFRDGVYEPDIEHFFERTVELMKDISKRHPKILMEQMIVSHRKEHYVYHNTNETEFEGFRGNYNVDMTFSAHDGELTTSLFGSNFSTITLDKPFLSYGSIEKDLADVEAQLVTVPFQGKMEGSVILTPGCLYSFLSSIVSNFASDSVILEKTSIWLEKLGKKVADDRISISFCPHDSRIVCGERFTSDGFLSDNFDFIKNGVLKSFYLSLFVANKSGFERAKNTSFSCIIEGGDTPYAEIIKSIKKGVIVGRFSGGAPGTNGDFSGVVKNSFLIEDGEIKGAINETMINGNLADLLNNLLAISSETVEDGFCVLPYMAFDKVIISGK